MPWPVKRSLLSIVRTILRSIFLTIFLTFLLVALPESGETAESNKVNRDIKSTNILFLWTAGNQLKVITLLVINHDSRKVGLVTIPLGSYYPGEPNQRTIGEIYKQVDRQHFIDNLEGYFGIPIPHQIEVEQQALKKMSNILGSFIVNGDTLDMAQAFQLTSTAQRTDDQDVVRAIANKLIHPNTLVKLPQLGYIMVREVQTNLKVKDIWRIFREFQGTYVGGLIKTALPGREYLERGKLYREVPVEEWKRILVKVSSVS